VTAKPIRQGATIVEIKGKIVTASEVWRYWKIDSRLAENCFRYDEEHYLDPDGEIGQYANHSCNPNSGIIKNGRRLILKAIASIAAGEEITHDYSTLLGPTMVGRCVVTAMHPIAEGWSEISAIYRLRQ